MKKLFFAVFLFFTLSFNALAASFPDVKPNDENYDAIVYLKDNGIINGYENGNFGPYDMVNRAAAVKMIMEAFKLNKNENYESIFSDVKKSDWFMPYVMGARNYGFVSGYGDKTFKPGQYVTLSEALKMIISAKEIKMPDYDSPIATDVSKDDWFFQYASYAKNNNIVLPDIEGKFFPNKTLTRAAFAEILYRVIKVNETGKPFDISSKWTIYDNSAFPFKIKYNENTWQITTSPSEILFFIPDKDLNQFSPARVYPNSAKLIFSVDPNLAKLNKVDYFKTIKKAFSGANFTEFKVKDLDAIEVLFPKQRYVDWYVFLPNNYVLVVYTDYGDGAIGFRIPQIIKGMLSTLEYKKTDMSSFGNTQSALLSRIFSNILVEGKGMETLNFITDKTIIETDAIGVGTGPVDYYFSQNLNYTFKYERSSDTILNKKEGKTSKF